jgi:anthranilate synthase/aminodeoxychorismate synthase-like glutamine amidotransferase
MILLIDNYDSFVWNLVQALGEINPALELGRELVVARNDELAAADVMVLDRGQPPSHIILSPGPCGPAQAGISSDIVVQLGGRVAILGVCLGHQCIGAANGMEVVRAARPMHGKTSIVYHDGRGLFMGIPSPITAMRYHSLVVPIGSVPRGWEVSAWTEEADGQRTVMGLRRAWGDASRAPLDGVQFHPESFLTPRGADILRNFLHSRPSVREPAARHPV